MGASILAPIPGRVNWPLKLHGFLNLGQLSQLQQSTCDLVLTPPGSFWTMQRLAELAQPSASAGLGLRFQQGPIRLELNFGLPIMARCGDGLRKGLQFGIGIDFL